MTKKKEMCSSENHEPGAGIVLMKLEELHSFEGHPFKVERNQELFELRCSIEKEGVLVPLLVRKNPNQKEQIKLPLERIGKYFPTAYTPKQQVDLIEKLLKNWAKQNVK